MFPELVFFFLGYFFLKPKLDIVTHIFDSFILPNSTFILNDLTRQCRLASCNNTTFKNNVLKTMIIINNIIPHTISCYNEIQETFVVLMIVKIHFHS